MKDSVKDKLREATEFIQIKAVVDDYIDYYNNDRYQWQLAKLSPNEYYQFCITGEYPLAVANPPSAPIAEKNPEELGKKRRSGSGGGTESRDSTLDAQHLGNP